MPRAPRRPPTVPADAIWDVDEWLACARDADGRFQGLYRNWTADGTLSYEGMVKDSKQYGEHRSYHPDGSVSRVAIWRDGVLHDDTYVRGRGDTTQPFPEDVADIPQIWSVHYLTHDGRADYTTRYRDEAGRELDRFGAPVPERPAAVPADARWESRFTWDDDLAPVVSDELGAFYGKLVWDDPAAHGWVHGALERDDNLRLGTWRWYSPSGALLREEEHDPDGLLLVAREWAADGRLLSEQTSGGLRAALDADLARAYELFLGRPLSAFDPSATYAFFFCIEDSESGPSAVGLEQWSDLAWADLLVPPSSTSARACDKPSSAALDWDRFTMDRGRSLYFVDEKALEGKAAKRRKHVPMTGAALAAAAERAKRSPSDLLGDLVYVRAQTDGSLRDAIAAATWTMSAPRGLSAGEDGECLEPWDEQLDEAVSNPRLAAHLKLLCQTDNSARSTGALFLGTDLESGMWDWAMTELPGTVLAAWQFGEGFASAAIVQLA